MAYVPEIIDLKPFYIQASFDSTAKDTTSWGLVPRVNPFVLMPKPKEPYKTEWFDQDGDSEFTANMFYEAMEISVGFYIKAYSSANATAVHTLRSQVESFFSYIRDGEFKIYDSYTDFGRKSVRYAGYEEGKFKSRKDWASATFTVKFKINDPVTKVKLLNGVLIEE
jgi:hypothetical protein